MHRSAPVTAWLHTQPLGFLPKQSSVHVDTIFDVCCIFWCFIHLLFLVCLYKPTAAVLTSRSCAGPQHTISLPPDLQGLPGGPAPTSRLGQGSHQRPARAQLPLAATQSVPAGSRLSAVTQAAYMDPTRLTSTNLGAQEQQQAMYGDRFAGSTALRRYSHVSDTQVVQKQAAPGM